MANVGDIIAKVSVFGVAGWVAENALCQQDRFRYSGVFGGVKIPFMPMYAVNGLALSTVAPYLEKWRWPTIARGLTYSVVGTGIEWLGCQIDRHVMNKRSWDYGRSEALSESTEGCVSLPRSALWAGVGLLAEKLA